MNKGLAALERIGKNKYQTTVANITGFERITISVKQDNKKDYQIIEKELQALEIISQNFKLVGNCLHAKNKYAKDGWVFVKELEDEEEHNVWKEVLL